MRGSAGLFDGRENFAMSHWGDVDEQPFRALISDDLEQIDDGPKST